MRRRNSRPLFLAAAALSTLVACAAEPGESGGAGGVASSGGGGATSTTSGVTSATASTSTSITTSATLPPVFTIAGIVTDGAKPLEGAIVMQGGGAPSFTTGPDGAFSIELTSAIPGTPAVVATKIGYRTRGVDVVELPTEAIVIELLEVKPPDNQSYAFHPPGVGDPESSTAFCDHCHTTFVKQFLTSAHARAAKDPLVQDLYAGVSGAAKDAVACVALGGDWRTGLAPGTANEGAFKCYVGGGVLPDLNPACGAPGEAACDDPALPAAKAPSAFGACADCHAPGIEGKAGGRDLHDAVGIAYENGNHCDVCHKARDVDLTKPAGVAGALVLQRPHEKLSDDPNAKVIPVMFGPLPDVPNEFMGGSYQPKFSAAVFCAACHEQRQPALLPGSALDPGRWPEGLPTLTTFSEWEASAFNDPGTPCQLCHMPPDDTGLVNTVDVTTPENASVVFGFVRPPEQIRKHIFRGPLEGSPRLIDGAMNLVLEVAPGTGTGGEPVVSAKVTVQNLLAGHAIPTGEPMRSLVLLVSAEGCAQTWSANGGVTVQDGGGFIVRGEVGASVTPNGASLGWAAGALVVKAGMRVRVVRPTGVFDDYAGIGFFADPALTAEEKGLERFAPVGEAAVLSAANGSVVLDAAIAASAGDVVFVGDAAPAVVADGGASIALAGAAGYTFAKTLVDAGGERHVHHYRAVDIASDNRIRPGGSAATDHTFAVPAGCSAGKVTATLVYRPVPVAMSRLRGWDAKDWVVAKATEDVTVN